MSLLNDILFGPIMELFDGGNSKKKAKQAKADMAAADARQAKQAKEIQAQQSEQKRLLDEKEAKIAEQERTSRLVRSAKKKGLLSYTDDGSATLGGSSA